MGLVPLVGGSPSAQVVRSGVIVGLLLLAVFTAAVLWEEEVAVDAAGDAEPLLGESVADRASAAGESDAGTALKLELAELEAERDAIQEELLAQQQLTIAALRHAVDAAKAARPNQGLGDAKGALAAPETSLVADKVEEAAGETVVVPAGVDSETGEETGDGEEAGGPPVVPKAAAAKPAKAAKVRAEIGYGGPASDARDAQERCMGAPAPYLPFVAGSAAGRRRALLEAEDAGLGAGQRRRLLAPGRSSAPPSRPLESRCSAVGKVKKAVSETEAGLSRCLKQKSGDCSAEEVDKVLAALQKLSSLNTLKTKPLKCLTINKKGCSSTSGNPETFPPRSFSGSMPLESSDVPRQFRTCALVGNGPGVSREGNIPAIEAHDAVFRFNAYRKTSVAGEKSTFRMFNRKRMDILVPSKFMATKGEHWLFWNYMGMPMLRKMKMLSSKSYMVSPAALKYTIDGYFAVRKDLQRLGIGGGCPTNLNSGLHAVFFALQTCETVNIFGFSYTPQMLSSRGDAISPRQSPHHDWATDTYVLRLLHLAGFVNMCTTPMS